MNPTASGMKIYYYLSLGHNYHKISYDGQNIEIKRYHRRLKSQDNSKIEYKYKLWGTYYDKFVTQQIEIQHKQASNFPWNYLDQLICGYYNDFIDNLKYWRIRYILVFGNSVAASNSLTTSMLGFPGINVSKKTSSTPNLFSPPQKHSDPSTRSAPTVDDSLGDKEKINSFIKFKNMLSTLAKGNSSNSSMNNISVSSLASSKGTLDPIQVDIVLFLLFYF